MNKYSEINFFIQSGQSTANRRRTKVGMPRPGSERMGGVSPQLYLIVCGKESLHKEILKMPLLRGKSPFEQSEILHGRNSPDEYSCGSQYKYFSEKVR